MLERPEDPDRGEDKTEAAEASAPAPEPAEAPAAPEAETGPAEPEAPAEADKVAVAENPSPEEAAETPAPAAEAAKPEATAAPSSAKPRRTARVRDRRIKEGESLAERVARQSRERSKESSKSASRAMRRLIILVLVLGLGYRFAYPFLKHEFLLILAHQGKPSWSDWAVDKMPEDGDPRAVTAYLRGLKWCDAERRSRYVPMLVRWVTPELRGELLGYMKSEEKEARRAALYARYFLHDFAWAQDGEITSRIAAILDADPDAQARVFAALIFTKYAEGPPPSYCPIVEKGCADGDTSVRRACLEALAHTRDQAYTDRFIAALEDEAPEVRLAGLTGLAYVGDHRAVELLTERYEAGAEDVRGHIVGLLGSMEDEHVIDLLCLACRDSDPSIAAEATRLLGRRAGDEATRGLMKALDSGFGEVRAEAARSLGRRGERAAIPKLIQNLKSYRKWGELEALDQALSQLTEAEGIPAPKGTEESRRKTVKAWLAWFAKGEGS